MALLPLSSNIPLYIKSINVSGLPVTLYHDISSDYGVQEQIVKYFYRKIVHEWLYEDINKILNYVTVSGNTVSLLPNLDAYKSDAVYKSSYEDLDKKVDFIRRNFFHKSTLFKVLNKLVKELGLRWIDLPKDEYHVKKEIKSYLKRKLRQAIVEQKK